MKGMTPAALGAALNGDWENAIAASTPGGIERQEAEGQRQLVNATVARLPKDIHDYAFRGKPAKEVYALAGIEVVGDCDDLFLNVKLPAGWKLDATDHSMWSKLLDDKGRERASIFYKAAFYDRSAHFNFTRRFSVREEPEDAYKSQASYEERSAMLRLGRVYDGETVVFATEGRTPIKSEPGAWEKIDAQQKELTDQCEAWLVANGYPDHTNPLAYWD